jgi:hypothetical protein
MNESPLWAKQYLQAFLSFNSEFEVLLAKSSRMEHLKATFPKSPCGGGGGSFWMGQRNLRTDSLFEPKLPFHLRFGPLVFRFLGELCPSGNAIRRRQNRELCFVKIEGEKIDYIAFALNDPNCFVSSHRSFMVRANVNPPARVSLTIRRACQSR